MGALHTQHLHGKDIINNNGKYINRWAFMAWWKCVILCLEWLQQSVKLGPHLYVSKSPWDHLPRKLPWKSKVNQYQSTTSVQCTKVSQAGIYLSQNLFQNLALRCYMTAINNFVLVLENNFDCSPLFPLQRGPARFSFDVVCCRLSLFQHTLQLCLI